MACPYFVPTQPIRTGARVTLPLGDAYEGECRAGVRPGRAHVLNVCNLGYAAGRCEGFSGGPDAVRFSIRDDGGGALRIWYVVERGHLPWSHGMLEYPAGPGCADPVLARQAEAYVESYLRRKNGSHASA